MILLKLFFAFFKIGIFSIGGGYVMLPLIEKEIITNHGWLTVAEFVDIVAIAEMTPGPIAINSATYIGYRTAGFFGSAAATAGVVMPSLLLVLLAASILKRFYQNEWVQAGFGGLRPAVVALITGAAIFIGRTAVTDLAAAIIAAGALLLLLKTRLHPILVLVLAALGGIIIYL
ncbi:MAG TPA: chromate transporter [Firmicutes bacterium]|jgi:chromate transporter|nr:chromate transporter [Bacillota bacterium]